MKKLTPKQTLVILPLLLGGYSSITFAEPGESTFVKDTKTGCKIYDLEEGNHSASWSGACVDGKISGNGTLTIVSKNPNATCERKVEMKEGLRTGRSAPHVRIVAASIEPKDGAKTRRRRGAIRQGIQGPGGGKAAAAGEHPGGAGIRRSGRERLDAGAVAIRSAGSVQWRRRACAPSVDGCGATAGSDCNGFAGRDGEVGLVPRAGGVCAGVGAVERECTGRAGRSEGGDQRRIH